MAKKPAKEKPLLHLIRGSGDRELFSSDLEFYFCQLQSIAGLSTVSGLNPTPEQQIGIGPTVVTESNWYDDSHISMSGPPGFFTRGRRVWQALVLLPWAQQLRLQGYYEPRQWFPPGFKQPEERQVREDHIAFYAAKKSLRAA